MVSSFCKLPQTRLWHDLRDHLVTLPGVAVTFFVCAPISGSWLDFTYQGHSFMIRDERGSFLFSVEDMACPHGILRDITGHFEDYLRSL